MWPGLESRNRRQMWVEFIVGSRPRFERFFTRYSGFSLSSKTDISKFQFDVDAVTAWKVKFHLKIYSFNRIGMLFGHFNAKT